MPKFRAPSWPGQVQGAQPVGTMQHPAVALTPGQALPRVAVHRLHVQQQLAQGGHVVARLRPLLQIPQVGALQLHLKPGAGAARVGG